MPQPNCADTPKTLRRVASVGEHAMLQDFDLQTQMELRRLSLLEQESWAAWERSQETNELTTNEKVVTDKSEAGIPLGECDRSQRLLNFRIIAIDQKCLQEHIALFCTTVYSR